MLLSNVLYWYSIVGWGLLNDTPPPLFRSLVLQVSVSDACSRSPYSMERDGKKEAEVLVGQKR
jgi:hypothetical protein